MPGRGQPRPGPSEPRVSTHHDYWTKPDLKKDMVAPTCSGNRQVLWLYQEGVRSGRSEGEEDAAATSTLAASRSPCIDTIHKYSVRLKYNLGIFAPDHPCSTVVLSSGVSG